MNRLLLSALVLIATPLAQAETFEIEIQNLTRGSYFTPLLVAAHPEGTALFEVGQPASTALQAMAEGGSIAELESQLQGLGATQSNNPAGGLLGPGERTRTTLNTSGAAANTRLSIVGMILPTNDGFVAANGLELPMSGTVTMSLNAYDAGTEGNDEIRGSGMPGQPGLPVPPPLDDSLGHNGSGRAAPAEGFVHIHRGVLGDTDSEGGPSDIDSTRHRWLNPVARVTITVQ